MTSTTDTPRDEAAGGSPEKSMLEISAICHREKWQFEETAAFDVLHRIGNLARSAALASRPVPAGGVKALEWEERKTPLGNVWWTAPNPLGGLPIEVSSEAAKAAAQADFDRRILSQIATAPAQAEGWRDMSSAPKDGTRILVLIFREACNDMDDVRRPAFAEVKEVFYKPYVQFGMNLPWHSGDPFDSHEGMAPEHMGEAVPIGWLPRSALPTAPVKGGE